MRLRRTVRTLAGIIVALYVVACYSAVQAMTPGWQLWGLSAAALVILITIALYRRRTAC